MNQPSRERRANCSSVLHALIVRHQGLGQHCLRQQLHGGQRRGGRQIHFVRRRRRRRLRYISLSSL